MATDNTKKKIGTMPCEGQRCKSHERNIPVVVFENKHGTLSYSCDWCQRAPYAKNGTEQHEDWLADMERLDAPLVEPQDPDPEPEPSAPVVAQPPAAPKKKASLSWLP